MSSYLMNLRMLETPLGCLASGEGPGFTQTPGCAGMPWIPPARVSAMRSTLARTSAFQAAEPHPYLPVLLADQEIGANRQDEAASLIEAAYAAYDRNEMGSSQRTDDAA